MQQRCQPLSSPRRLKRAKKEDAGPTASRGVAPVTPPKASEPRKALYKGYTEEEWEEWRQAQNQPVRRTYKQKWKSNEELEAQRRRPGKREREALRQQGPAVPVPRETPKWPPPPPPSPRRAVKREQTIQSENPPGEEADNAARSSRGENPPAEVADSGARSSQSENPQSEVQGQAKEEKAKAEEEPSRLRRRHQKSKGPNPQPRMSIHMRKRRQRFWRCGAKQTAQPKPG